MFGLTSGLVAKRRPESVIYFGFVLLTVLPCICAYTNCYSCKGLTDPTTCKHSVQCPAGQHCMITKTVQGDGHPAYDMGCGTSDVCSSLTGGNTVIGRRQSGGECKACCNTAHCNKHCCNNNATMAACCSEAGYQYLEDTDICVKLHASVVSWQAAEAICQEENGHLIIIRDLADYNAVKHGIKDELAKVPVTGNCSSANQFWIGGNDIDTENVFKWWNGQTFTHWQRHQLHANDGSCDKTTGADCVLIGLHHAHWNDRHCDYGLPFVCQIQ